MMGVAVLAAVMSQDICGSALGEARALAVRMDTEGAVIRLEAGAKSGCDVDVAVAFLKALAAGRAAWARGGDEASLRPLKELIAVIEQRTQPGSPEEIAVLLIRATAAAAQNERDELFAYLSQALQVERARGARGLSGAPILTAHELAGELWLDVHRYDDAVAAFRIARGASGDSPRLVAGLARALARQRSTADACTEYRRLTADASARLPSMARELAEARAFLALPACRAGDAR
jgi:hypothetical protein